MSRFINKIHINQSEQCRIMTEWCNEHFNFSLLKEKTAWKNTINYSTLKQFPDLLELSLNTYVEELQSVLTIIKKQFIFNLNRNLFTVYEIMDEVLEINRKFAEFTLEEVDYYESAELFIDNSLLIVADLEEQKNLCLGESEAMIKDNKQLHEQIAQVTSDRQNCEQKLMQSFLTLLNAKKDRICQLYEIISDQQTLHVCNCRNNVAYTNIEENCTSSKVRPVGSPPDDKLNQNTTKTDLQVKNENTTIENGNLNALKRWSEPGTSTGGYTNTHLDHNSQNSIDRDLFVDTLHPQPTLTKRVRYETTDETTETLNAKETKIEATSESPELDFDLDDYLGQMQ